MRAQPPPPLRVIGPAHQVTPHPKGLGHFPFLLGQWPRPPCRPPPSPPRPRAGDPGTPDPRPTPEQGIRPSRNLLGEGPDHNGSDCGPWKHRRVRGGNGRGEGWGGSAPALVASATAHAVATFVSTTNSSREALPGRAQGSGDPDDGMPAGVDAAAPLLSACSRGAPRRMPQQVAAMQ